MNEYMNEAIRLAIEEGGYKKDPHLIDLMPLSNKTLALAVLDPLFWQALSKALGWDKTHTVWFKQSWENREPWLNHAHQHFDLILTGGDIESFWKELLKSKVS